MMCAELWTALLNIARSSLRLAGDAPAERNAVTPPAAPTDAISGAEKVVATVLPEPGGVGGSVETVV